MDNISELFDLFGETIFCSICHEDIKEGERVCLLSDCKHGFHNTCIVKWFKEKHECPVCRKNYNLIINNNSYELMDDIERLFLTYTIIYGILKKLNTAELFNQNKNNIKNICSSFRLLPVDLDSRYSFYIMKQYIANRISKYLNIEKNKIRKHPSVYIWIDKIERSPNFRTLVEPLWAM